MEIQIISGFLGVGKTTFLNKYLPLLEGTTVVLENEFGKINLDSGLIEGDLPVRELSAGCICCTLATELRTAIAEIAEKYHPHRILIEPSGVAMLGDIIRAASAARLPDGMELRFTKRITIVDAACFSAYAEGFPFYLEQAENAGVILLSHLAKVKEEKKAKVVSELRRINPRAVIYDGDWRETEGDILLTMIEQSPDLEDAADLRPSDAPISDDLFSSLSIPAPPKLKAEDPSAFLAALTDGSCGRIVRAKGYLPCASATYYIDLTLSGTDFRKTEDESKTGLVIIGSGMDRMKVLGTLKNS